MEMILPFFWWTPSEGARYIREFACSFPRLTNKQEILVISHTDNFGDRQTAQRLSENQAYEIVKLFGEAGIDRTRINSLGAGASLPLASNETPDGRAQNRRIEIWLFADDATLTAYYNSISNTADAYLARRTPNGSASMAAAVPETTPVRPYTQATITQLDPAPTPIPIPGISPAPQTPQPTTEPSYSQSPQTPSIPPPPISYFDPPPLRLPQTSPLLPASPPPLPPLTPLTPQDPPALVDFGGEPINPADEKSWPLAQVIRPKSGGFPWIFNAHANDLPSSGCGYATQYASDARQTRRSDTERNTRSMRDYLPGMNGRAWTGLVNGHQVTISPVLVLSKSATVTQDPVVYVNRDNNPDKRRPDYALNALAHTWEGENAILYRVFIAPAQQQPLQCLDIVLPKTGGSSLGAELIYLRGTQLYRANLGLQATY